MLPIFVYGTLRPGWGNSRTWAGIARPMHDGLVTVDGYRLVSNGAFPYAIPAEGETTTGCLIAPDADCYDMALARMDHLEGVPHHYRRISVGVEMPNALMVAWLYTPADPEVYADLRSVPGNDWTAAHLEPAR